MNVIESAIKMNDEMGFVNWKTLIEKYGCTQSSIYKEGGIKKICKEHNLTLRDAHRPDPKDIESDFLSVYKKNGRITTELYLKEGKYSKQAIKTAFGSVENLMNKLSIEPNIRRDPSDEDVLEDIVRVYNEYGTASSTVYRKNGLYTQAVIERKFGSWCDALERVGIDSICKKRGRDAIKKDLISLYKEYGFLGAHLINTNCDYTYQAVIQAFGSKDNICKIVGDPHAFRDNQSSGAANLQSVLEKIYGKEKIETEKTYAWLKNPKTNYNLFVDFVIESEMLCIEFDGAQHFNYSELFHDSIDSFEMSKYRDYIKDELLTSHGYKVIRFSFKDKITIDTVINKINS